MTDDHAPPDPEALAAALKAHPLDQVLGMVEGLGPGASRHATAALAAAMARWVPDERTGRTLDLVTAALCAGPGEREAAAERCAAGVKAYGVWGEVSAVPGLEPAERLSLAMVKALRVVGADGPGVSQYVAEVLSIAADQHSTSEGVGRWTDQ